MIGVDVGCMVRAKEEIRAYSGGESLVVVRKDERGEVRALNAHYARVWWLLSEKMTWVRLRQIERV